MGKRDESTPSKSKTENLKPESLDPTIPLSNLNASFFLYFLEHKHIVKHSEDTIGNEVDNAVLEGDSNTVEA